MITFLAKVFIKDYQETGNAKVRQAYGSLCSIMGIVFNLILFGIKYTAGTLSGSIAIVADAMNSLSDAGSSIITLLGFKLAGRKPNPEHPFGHGRIEYISGLAVSFLVLLMGVELGKSAISKIISPEPVEGGTLVVVILVISILVKCYMAFYNHGVGKKLNSSAMKATATDSLSDAASTTVVLICTILAKYTTLNLDGWAGAFVALLVLYAGFGAVKETIAPLLGQAPEEEFVEAIKELVLSEEKIVGLHDLVVHDYGPGRVMISLHAEVPGDEDVFVLHDCIDVMEAKLKMELGCDATIHMDPIAVNDEQTNALKKMVHNIVVGIDEKLSIHDFRMVAGPTHTNLLFDVVLPAGYEKTPDEMRKIIQEEVWKENKTYFCVIEVDQDYVGR